jgi:chromosomal replication initiation ATPase DnaA
MKEDRAKAGVAIALAAAAVGTPPDAIIAGVRKTQVAFARQVAMYIAYTAYGMSLSRVAAAFGRDRSTIAHACRVMEERREDGSFDRWMDSIEASAANTPVAG